jgi:hypothetical protein
LEKLVLVGDVRSHSTEVDHWLLVIVIRGSGEQLLLKFRRYLKDTATVKTDVTNANTFVS